MQYSVIIPAAGSGSRMGADVPKVLLKLEVASSQASIIQRSVDIFSHDAACERIVVCIPPAWHERFAQELSGRPKVTLLPGGATRQDSVRLGVEALCTLLEDLGGEQRSTTVLVHDAARCCVSLDVVRRVVEGVGVFGAVTAAVYVPDTLSKVSGGVITSFVDREGVWAVQTPQGFILGELRSAHFAAKVDGFVALDDASVVARLRDVHVVEGDRLNIKVTHPQDLEVAARVSRVG